MDKQALGRIAVARKTEAQIRAEAEETGMPADRPGMPDRMQQGGEANALIAPVQASEGRIGRSERIGRAWKIKDEELWNPFEVVFFVLWIIFGFGFLMGRDHFLFAAELFLPVAVFGLAVVVVQAVMRRRAGEKGVLAVMRDRIR